MKKDTYWRRLKIAFRWVYPGSYFYQYVIKGTSNDLFTGLRAFWAGLALGVLAILAFPIRIINWVISPFYIAFFLRKNKEGWDRLEEVLENNEKQ